MDCSDGRLTAEVAGEIEKNEDDVLVIRRIRVHFRLVADEEQRSTVERVHGVFAEHCPVYRSIRDAIQITTDYELVAAA